MALTYHRVHFLLLVATILLVKPAQVEGLQKETVAAASAGCIAGLVVILGLGIWFYDTYVRKYRHFDDDYGATTYANPYARGYTNPVNTISGKIELDADNYGFSDTPTY